MLDGIKKRLIHFESDGKSVVSDFVSARQRRVGALRRTVHACFYIQCAAALVCAVWASPWVEFSPGWRLR